MSKWIALIILFVFIAIFHIGFLNEFNMLRQYTNTILIVTIFFSIMLSIRVGLAAAFTMGMLYDIMSPYPFTTTTLTLIVCVLVIHYFFKKLLTQKTTSSIVVMLLIATGLYYAMHLVITSLVYAVGFDIYPFTFNIRLISLFGGQLILNPLLGIGLLLLIRLFKKMFGTRFFISQRV